MTVCSATTNPGEGWNVGRLRHSTLFWPSVKACLPVAPDSCDVSVHHSFATRSVSRFPRPPGEGQGEGGRACAGDRASLSPSPREREGTSAQRSGSRNFHAHVTMARNIGRRHLPAPTREGGGDTQDLAIRDYSASRTARGEHHDNPSQNEVRRVHGPLPQAG
jgi:hypothetical protein